MGGYGRVSYAGRGHLVHRLLYGDVPAGMQVDHKCRVPACANPAHLEAVTASENVRRSSLHLAMWLVAQEARSKPECVNGHARTPENVYTSADGKPVCKVCRRIGMRGKRK